MKEIKRNKNTDILKLNAQLLREKQSVRATFSLPDQIIDLLKVAAKHLNVQQKSLIDQLVEDRISLENLAAAEQTGVNKNRERRQKTFVLSRGSLELLDEISRELETSRDYLIELSISRLIPFLDAEQEKHNRRRMLIVEVDRYLKRGRTLLDKADEMLSPDDKFRIKLEKIIKYSERTIEDMKKYIKEKESLMY